METWKYYKRDKETGAIVTSDYADTYAGDNFEPLTKKDGKLLYREQACKHLRGMLKPGTKVYTKLCHVSKSGMSREITLHVVIKKELRDITYRAAIAMNERIGNKGGIVIGGCGMDMGFALVYNLGATLWPNGTRKPHSRRNGEPDKSGGYALKQEWI